VNVAVRAFYKQQGWDTDLSQWMKRYETMLSQDEKKYGGYAYYCAKVALDKRISITWRFP
jgi:hypothetical protein